MPGINCSVYECNNNFANTRHITPKVKFYSFPGLEWEKAIKQDWIRFVNRVNSDGTPWRPSKFSKICSVHFVGNIKSRHPKSQSFNPTILPNPMPIVKSTNFPRKYQAFERTNSEFTQRDDDLKGDGRTMLKILRSTKPHTGIKVMKEVRVESMTVNDMDMPKSEDQENRININKVKLEEVQLPDFISCDLVPGEPEVKMEFKNELGIDDTTVLACKEEELQMTLADFSSTITRPINLKRLPFCDSQRLPGSDNYSNTLNDLWRFICGDCGQVFPSYKLLIAHDASHATFSTPKSPESDSESESEMFAKNSRLTSSKNEKTTTAPLPFKCDVCEKTFCRAYVLKTHKLTIHSIGDCRFVCSICNSKWTSHARLAIHSKTHDDKDKSTPLEKFQCKFCQKSFLENHKLARHIATHTKETLFKCKVCGMTAWRLDVMQRHELTHQPTTKIFKCSQCPKGFSRKEYLREHGLKIHKDRELK